MPEAQAASSEFTHDVALSFAGEDRTVVETFAKELRERGVQVFYDRFFEVELWGNNLFDYLSEVYAKKSRYCVVFVSKAYMSRDWTVFESDTLKARHLRDHSGYLLPVHLDGTSLTGPLSLLGHIDMKNQTVTGLADLLCAKLGIANAKNATNPPPQEMVLELYSNFDYNASGSSARQKMNKIQDAVLALAGFANGRLVGLERTPHRLQIQATPSGYSKLRSSFFSGELNAKTGVQWTQMTALEGKERAPAPTQVPLVPLGPMPTNKRTRQVVCHMPSIIGFEAESEAAIKFLGKEVTSDMRAFRAYITSQGDFIYIHSNFVKTGCTSPTKIATNLPVDLLTIFFNLVETDLPNKATVARARETHTKYAQYMVQREKVRRRGDEFYNGALNVRFV